MKIAIVSNISDGIGLYRDYEILKDFLVSLGHAVTGMQYDLEPDVWETSYDLAIYLEVVPRHLLELSERRWWFGNPEWTKPEMIRIVDKMFERIFAKTREAERIFEQLFPGRVHYTGFAAHDRQDLTIRREKVFLHIAGNSIIRGTQAVVDAWKWKRNGKKLDAKLVIVGTGKFDYGDLQGDPRVEIFSSRVSDKVLLDLQNRCLYHLFPSGTEGFGHALHEALGVNAMVLTTGAPPMNEIEHAYYIPPTHSRKYNLAEVYEVSALDIFRGVEQVLRMAPDDIARLSNRSEFLYRNARFGELMYQHLEVATKPKAEVLHKPGRKSVAFIGNFQPAESTENMVKWALENRLLMNVEPLQEDLLDLTTLRTTMQWNDALIWIRTPGMLKIVDEKMTAFLEELRDRDIPTISMHLDKFFGLPERERLIGVHPFWKTQHVWTADGSPGAADFFAGRGVNHRWMIPAVSEVYCHPGKPEAKYRSDIAFVGAYNYHAEYPFRKMMVDFLRKEYGDRFHHWEGIRGHDLNDVYASSKVVVGDCIFAGTPRYWSDRVPETCGRGGLLLHPRVTGLANHPVLFYEPQDLVSLQKEIEEVLALDDGEGMVIQQAMMKYTLNNDTWTIRMQQILNTSIGPNAWWNK